MESKIEKNISKGKQNKSNPLKDLASFYLEKKQDSGLLYSASLSFSFINKNQESTPEQIWIQSYLRKHFKNFNFRNLSRNILKGALITTPKSKKNALMLGIVYWDKEDSDYNEDLYEICKNNIKLLKPRDALKEYPEYKGYHRGNKKYLENNKNNK